MTVDDMLFWFLWVWIAYYAYGTNKRFAYVVDRMRVLEDALVKK